MTILMAIPSFLQSHSISRKRRSEGGLLLRTDLHDLFDLELLGIDIAKRKVEVFGSLLGTPYEDFQGAPFMVPEEGAEPDPRKLDRHLRRCRQRAGFQKSMPPA